VSGRCALFNFLRDLPQPDLLRRAILSRYPGPWSAWLRGCRARCPLAAGNSDVARWGSFDAGICLLSVAAWFLAAGALVSWYVLLRPNIVDIVKAYVPALPLGLLITGGLIFSMVNAAVEEGAYRGVFLHALDSTLGAGFAALLLQALAFGAIHIRGFPRGWLGVGLACIFGLFMGVIRRRGGGMFAPWIAHVFTDVVIAGIVLLLARPERPNQAMQRTASQPAIYLLRVCHPPFGCESHFNGFAVADLVSR
jgi:membrane protease YdiL (CAAX protease family)